jgi:hypothetical protein
MRGHPYLWYVRSPSGKQKCRLEKGRVSKTYVRKAYRVIFLRSTNKSNNIGFLGANKRKKKPIDL